MTKWLRVADVDEDYYLPFYAHARTGGVTTARVAADPTPIMDLNTAGGIYIDKSRVSLWRRVWFLVSAVPRYLISGSVEVP